MTSKLYLKEQPTLADLQKYVADMEDERGFTHESLQETFILLTEEIGELAKCVRKTSTSMSTDANKTYDFDVAGEFADVLIVLAACANRMGIDLEKAFRDKEEVNKQRTWN